MIAAQDGDPDADLPWGKETQDVVADSDGVLERLDALAVGVAAWRLGAGRARQGEPVQAGAGVELHAKPGDTVRAGQPLLTLHTDTPERFDRALAALDGAWSVAPESSAHDARAGPRPHRPLTTRSPRHPPLRPDPGAIIRPLCRAHQRRGRRGVIPISSPTASSTRG